MYKYFTLSFNINVLRANVFKNSSLILSKIDLLNPNMRKLFTSRYDYRESG